MTRKIEEAKGPPGAFKLLAHIREHFDTIPKFCDKKGIDRIKVQKAIKGEFKRIDVSFALDVQAATDGKVALEDWVPGETSEGDAA